MIYSLLSAIALLVATPDVDGAVEAIDRAAMELETARRLLEGEIIEPPIPDPVACAAEPEFAMGDMMAAHGEANAALALTATENATHCVDGAGRWVDPGTWNVRETPGEGARVYVPANASLTLEADIPHRLDWIRIDGNLSATVFSLNVETIVIGPTGSLSLGDKDNHAIGEILFIDTGPIDPEGDPLGISRGLINLGSLSTHGADKSPFAEFAGATDAGASTITLKEPPAGWQEGDKLFITSTRGVRYRTPNGVLTPTEPLQEERRTVVAIEGNILTLDSPLEFAREAGPWGDNAHVINLSRSLTFKGENCADQQRRAHGMSMTRQVSLAGVAIECFGRTNKSFNSFSASSFVERTPEDNIKGRYGFHFHRCGRGQRALVRNSVIDGGGSPIWGFDIHDCDANMIDNAVVAIAGSAYVNETLNENVLFEGNIAAQCLPARIGSPKGGDNVANFDLAFRECFWLGRSAIARNNIASGAHGGDGFIWMNRLPDAFEIDTDARDLVFREIARGEEAVNTNHVPIRGFEGNRCYASDKCLHVIKSAPRQNHGVRSFFSDTRAWNMIGSSAFNPTYTAHYSFNGLKAHCQDRANCQSVVEFGPNTVDMTILNVEAVGYERGVFARFPVNQKIIEDSGATGEDDFDYGYVIGNIDCGECIVAEPAERFDVVDVPDVALAASFAPGDITSPGLPNHVYEIGGTVTDSLGSYKIGLGTFDTFSGKGWQLIDLANENGYCTNADQSPSVTIDEPFSDRMTGETKLQPVSISVPPDWIDDHFPQADYRGPC